MSHSSIPIFDNTVALAVQGYGWLPNLRRRTAADAVRTRLMGQHTVALCGPDAARFFYDEEHVRRRTAIPEPVRGTIFGHGAVHTLDGDHHRRRKAMFMSLMTVEGIATLVEYTTEAWEEAVRSWTATARPVVLFDEASRVLTRSTCRWAGIPLTDAEVPEWAADLVALVDGFATAGPRHWRARRARGRLERQLARLVDDVRQGDVMAPAGSALDAVANHREPDGEPLGSRLAAVELLNVVRPTVAVCWFVAFSAHAMHRWPEHRAALRDGDPRVVAAFAQEVRRFYPFAPFVGARAVKDLSWRGEHIPAGALVLLDIYGQNHHPALWPEPYAFRPERFLGREIGEFDLIPQGGGDPRTGHRCPGEAIAVALLEALTLRLARLDYDVPAQDLTIALHRVPARPASGFILTAAPARDAAGIAVTAGTAPGT